MSKIEHTDKLNSNLINYDKYYNRVETEKNFSEYRY